MKLIVGIIVRVAKNMDFEEITKSIQHGRTVSISDLLPFLCAERREVRLEANLKLAQAYYGSGDSHQACIFIDRAWALSRFSPDVLDLYVAIHAAENDIESIRDAYKRLGMAEASHGAIPAALDYFNKWQYAYASHWALDKYVYDYDVLDCVERMALPYRYKSFVRHDLQKDGKIRIAYLVQGMTELNSVLVKINLMFAKYHDKKIFEIVFFVPDGMPGQTLKRIQDTIESFRKCNCRVVTAPSQNDGLMRLLAAAGQIRKYKPHVLIVSALLAAFENYFIAMVRPAPVIVGLVQGPPQQFAAPGLDWSIAWSKHPLIDYPCDCSLVHIGLDLPVRASLVPVSKQALNIPENSDRK